MPRAREFRLPVEMAGSDCSPVDDRWIGPHGVIVVAVLLMAILSGQDEGEESIDMQQGEQYA